MNGSIESEDVTAHFILDKNNNSIHLYVYGSRFDSKQKRISVKQAVSQFPEGEDFEMVGQDVKGEFRSYEAQIEDITGLKEG